MVKITEIEGMIPSALHEWLSTSGKYGDIAAQAMAIITSKVPMETADPRPPELNWIVAPFAFIVEFIAADMIGTPSEESARRTSTKYETALAILKSRAIKARIDKINGLYEGTSNDF